MVVRARSALGLKYLEIDRGNSSQGFEPGATVPLTAARPEPVEIDQVFNMFDDPTRVAIQSNLLEFGNALAGRGVDLNEAIGQLKPLVQVLDPGDEEPGRPEHRSRQLRLLAVGARRPRSPRSPRSRASSSPTSTRPSGLSPASPRPFIQESISRRPPTEDTAIATLPPIRPFLANTAKLFGELRPGFHAIAPASRTSADGDRRRGQGPRARPGRSTPSSTRPPSRCSTSRTTRGARQGITDLTQFNNTLGPPLSLHHPRPVGLQLRRRCCSATSPASLSSGNGIGTSQRFIVLQPPARARTARSARARRRPTAAASTPELPPLQPLSEHRRAGPDA